MPLLQLHALPPLGGWRVRGGKTIYTTCVLYLNTTWRRSVRIQHAFSRALDCTRNPASGRKSMACFKSYPISTGRDTTSLKQTRFAQGRKPRRSPAAAWVSLSLRASIASEESEHVFPSGRPPPTTSYITATLGSTAWFEETTVKKATIAITDCVR